MSRALSTAYSSSRCSRQTSEITSRMASTRGRSCGRWFLIAITCPFAGSPTDKKDARRRGRIADRMGGRLRARHKPSIGDAHASHRLPNSQAGPRLVRVGTRACAPHPPTLRRLSRRTSRARVPRSCSGGSRRRVRKDRSRRGPSGQTRPSRARAALVAAARDRRDDLPGLPTTRTFPTLRSLGHTPTLTPHLRERHTGGPRKNVKRDRRSRRPKPHAPLVPFDQGGTLRWTCTRISATVGNLSSTPRR